MNRKFIKEMFVPGPLLSHSAMKAQMERIVHSSIIRLNRESMDKLYDLIIMAIKYQIFSIVEAPLLLKMTTIHINSWNSMTDDPEIILHIHFLTSLMTHVSSSD